MQKLSPRAGRASWEEEPEKEPSEMTPSGNGGSEETSYCDYSEEMQEERNVWEMETDESEAPEQQTR